MDAVHSPWKTVYDSTSSQASVVTERVITIDNARSMVQMYTTEYEAQENKRSEIDSFLKIQCYRLLTQNYYLTQR